MTTLFPGYANVVSPLPALPVFPDHEFAVDLAGTLYVVGLRYNRKGGYWALSLYDADRTPRILGRKIVANWPSVDDIPQARPAFGSLLPEADVDVPFPQDALGDTLRLLFVTLAPEV